ncbi:MAG: hypothetical protein FJZ83_00510 [Chloroflexi bacterium]|nr:hypothetical protein [Chloroflexota bacterium]MBM3182496.1 hypothetical protein [Chloroflexota bacterium]MBM4452003.1 hypothetical protein [Chloroflexota bacterium]MBM4453487.1 hypothetical protein [Chloroflexota bacterium]
MNKGTLKSPKSRTRGMGRRWPVAILEFVILFLFWLIFAHHWELSYILVGVFAAGLVVFLTSDFLYSSGSHTRNEEITFGFLFMSILRLFVYIPWLLFNIVKANINVATIILDPRMPINPVLLRFKTQMRRDISLVTLANSITLTPGTITVDLNDNTYTIHALVPITARDLETGLMQNKVGYVFGEKRGSPPEVLRASSLEKLE